MPTLSLLGRSMHAAASIWEKGTSIDLLLLHFRRVQSADITIVRFPWNTYRASLKVRSIGARSCTVG